MKLRLLALLVGIHGPAAAQTCRPPDLREPIVAERPADELARPGRVGGYTLALSWSPEYCRGNRNDRSEQCDGAHGRFGFILHGLWPEGPTGGQAPRYCRARTLLEPAIVRAQFCTMPSTRLIAHQWAKHGSCAARDPGDYFAAGRRLFVSLRLPDMAALSTRRIDAGSFKRLVSSLNPAIRTSSLIVLTDRRGDWFEELRICLDVQLRPTACRRDRPRGAPPGAPVRIWRP